MLELLLSSVLSLPIAGITIPAFHELENLWNVPHCGKTHPRSVVNSSDLCRNQLLYLIYQLLYETRMDTSGIRLLKEHEHGLLDIPKEGD